MPLHSLCPKILLFSEINHFGYKQNLRTDQTRFHWKRAGPAAEAFILTVYTGEPVLMPLGRKPRHGRVEP